MADSDPRLPGTEAGREWRDLALSLRAERDTLSGQLSQAIKAFAEESDRARERAEEQEQRLDGYSAMCAEQEARADALQAERDRLYEQAANDLVALGAERAAREKAETGLEGAHARVARMEQHLAVERAAREKAEADAKEAISLVYGGPVPTFPERMAGLPPWARVYIARIETECDPANTQRTVMEQRENIAALTVALKEAEAERDEARAENERLTGLWMECEGISARGALEPTKTNVLAALKAGQDAWGALAELVAIKDHKDAHGKDAEYERRQPLAWAAARSALANQAPAAPRSSPSSATETAGDCRCAKSSDGERVAAAEARLDACRARLDRVESLLTECADSMEARPEDPGLQTMARAARRALDDGGAMPAPCPQRAPALPCVDMRRDRGTSAARCTFCDRTLDGDAKP